MRVKDGKLKIGNVKRNRATAKAPKPDRVAYPLEIPELAGASGKTWAELSSGLVKLPVGSSTPKTSKPVGTSSGNTSIAIPIGLLWSKPILDSPRTAFGMARPTEEPLPVYLSDGSPHQ